MNAYFRLATMFFIAVVCGAQSPRTDTIAVRGEVVSSTPLVGYWTVELTSYGTGSIDKAWLSSDNSFEFQAITPGPYSVRVISPTGEIVHQEVITVASHFPITIHLSEGPVASRSRDAVVSLQQLRHKIPAAAAKAFQEGRKEVSKDHPEAARTHFQQAVTIDPEFVAAYNELGIIEAGMQHLPEAAAQFQKALELSPEDPLALQDLTLVLAKMQCYHDAIEVARRALKVASLQASGNVHYILALSLAAEHGDMEEMLLHFEMAASDYPKAHLAAADLLLKCGRSQEAIREMEAYLETAKPGDPQSQKVEARLAELRQ